MFNWLFKSRKESDWEEIEYRDRFNKAKSYLKTQIKNDEVDLLKHLTSTEKEKVLEIFDNLIVICVRPASGPPEPPYLMVRDVYQIGKEECNLWFVYDPRWKLENDR